MRGELVTDYILPVKICDMGGNIEGAEKLLFRRERQIGLAEAEVCKVTGRGYITLDFGMEYSGGARILTYLVTGGSTAPVRLRFGESLSEAYAEIGEKGAGNDHSLRDINTYLTSYSDMTFAQTGYRFLRIDFLDDSEKLIKNVYCAFSHREFPEPVPFKGETELDDEIYKIAKRTIDLCCQEYIWDGIKRDRLVWIGDMHPETLALTSLYGQCGIIEKSLDFTVRQYPVGTWMNHMPMYSVWWLIIMADYAEITGAKAYALRHKEYVKGLISQINACVADNGDLDFPSYFVDWPTHEQEDEPAGCRAILLFMTRKMSAFCSLLEIDDSEVKQLREKLMKQSVHVVDKKQVVALKYFALGEIDEKDKRLIAQGGAKGMSTFMSYYILKAVADTISVEAAKAMMREYYGAMLKKGATTFFEDFDMDWVENSTSLDELPTKGQRDIHGDFGKYCYIGFRHSFCHGWSAGVLRFLYEYCNRVK